MPWSEQTTHKAGPRRARATSSGGRCRSTYSSAAACEASESARAPVLAIVCSDHGTAYGEDGYRGHRLAHPVVWTVPYAEFVLPRSPA